MNERNFQQWRLGTQFTDGYNVMTGQASDRATGISNGSEDRGEFDRITSKGFVVEETCYCNCWRWLQLPAVSITASWTASTDTDPPQTIYGPLSWCVAADHTQVFDIDLRSTAEIPIINPLGVNFTLNSSDSPTPVGGGGYIQGFASSVTITPVFYNTAGQLITGTELPLIYSTQGANGGIQNDMNTNLIVSGSQITTAATPQSWESGPPYPISLKPAAVGLKALIQRGGSISLSVSGMNVLIYKP